MREAISKYRRFVIIATVALFLSFAFDFFGAVPSLGFVDNYQDSQSLVTNEILCGGNLYDGQLLQLKSGPAPITNYKCERKSLTFYGSQFGLQGRLYTLGYKMLSLLHVSVKHYIPLAMLVTALLSALAVGLIGLWIRVRFGLTAATTTVALVALSPMPVGFARNLYWAFPLLILPLGYVLWAYKSDLPVGKKIWFWVIAGLLLCAKFLCGYEYLTTMTIMVAAAVVYHLYVTKATCRLYVREIALTFAASILGFCLAFAIHIAALVPDAHSIGNAFNIVKQRALVRTVDTGMYAPDAIAGLQRDLPDFYEVSTAYLNLGSHTHGKHSVYWAAIAAGLNYLWMPVVTSPLTIAQPLATYVQSFAALVAALIALYLTRRKWLVARQRREAEGLFLASLVGAVAYVSWLIFAPSHSFVHAFLNGILVFMPMAFFGFAAIGLYIEYALTKIRSARA